MSHKTEKDIIMTGYAAMGGISYILYNEENIVRRKLPGLIIDNAKRYIEEAAHKTDSDKLFGIIHDTDSSAAVSSVGEGGIYKALWNAAESLGTGITVYQKMIPIRQEFIEICECYNINPYMFDGKGAHIIISEYGNRIIRLLERYGINCVIIGHTTDNNDKVIINNDERRYIESRIVDEMIKIGGLE